jgi:hypothetical protein
LLQKKQETSVASGTSSVSYAEDQLQNVGKVIFPVTTMQSANANTYAQGSIPAPYTRDRSIYGAIMDQLYGPVTDSMQSVTLTIKGDPYWLGAGNLERCIGRSASIKTPRNHTKKDALSSTQADYTYGDLMFLLSFKYPLGVDDTGTPQFKFNEHFTGIFRVVGITHTFANGSFKQDIQAARMPLVDAFKSLNLAAYSADQLQKATTASTVSSQATGSSNSSSQ